MQEPIIKGKFEIKKMEMKGGWSYVILPHLDVRSGLPFGWYIVKGSIDDYEISQYKLWPTKDKKLFLPIKTKIRKKIRKEVGDWVSVTLFEDKSEVVIPDEFLLCLNESPLAKMNFEKMSFTSQKQYVDFVYGAKSLDAQARRLLKAIVKLEQGLKYHEKDPKNSD